MGGSLKLCIALSILVSIVVTECKNDDQQNEPLLLTTLQTPKAPDTRKTAKSESTNINLNAKKPRSSKFLFSTYLPPTSTPKYYTRTTRDWFHQTTPGWYTTNQHPEHYITYWHPPYTTYWHTTYKTNKHQRYTTYWHTPYTTNKYTQYTTNWHPPYTTGKYQQYTTPWHLPYTTQWRPQHTTRWHPLYTTYETKPWYYRTTRDWINPTTFWGQHPTPKTHPSYIKSSTYPQWQTKGWRTTHGYHHMSTTRYNPYTTYYTKPWFYQTTINWRHPTSDRWRHLTTPMYYHPNWQTGGWKTTPNYPYWTTKEWNTAPWYYRTTRNRHTNDWNTTPKYGHWSTRSWKTTPYWYPATTKTTPNWFPRSTTEQPNTKQPNSGQLLQQAVLLQCPASGWLITVNMQLLQQQYPGIQASDIYLGISSCRGRQTGSTLIFSQSYIGCQTVETVRNNILVYSNTIKYALRGAVQPFTTQNSHWEVDVECDIERTGLATVHIHHDHNNTASPHVTGVGSYGIRMAFYSDSNFMYPISGSPLHVPVGSQVYTKVFTPAADWNIKMKLDHCYMRTGITQYGQYADYDLIKNGCPTDHNTHFIIQSTHETRFVFKDFQNNADEEGFDVRCHVTFCSATDVTPRCQQTCNTHSVLIG